MNFFRSEEHLRNWKGFEEKRAGGTISLQSLMDLFSSAYFRERGRPDYVSHMGEYMAGFMGKLDDLPDAGDYWRLKPHEKLGFKLALKLGLM
jgi:hypothetical protein